MTPQLPLQLQLRHAPGLDDFIVGDNSVVVDRLQHCLDSDAEPLIFLTGHPGSGRTHLLMGVCKTADARALQSAYLPMRELSALDPAMLDGLEELDLVAVDDIESIANDRAWEEAIFALFNRCRERDTRLVFSATVGPTSLPIELADLRSRLSWGLTLALKPLNDEDREQLIQALATRFAMPISDDVSQFLMQRASRHPKDLVDIVDRLNQTSLAERRAVTIPLVKRCLQL